jgi:hypothetical protein
LAAASRLLDTALRKRRLPYLNCHTLHLVPAMADSGAAAAGGGAPPSPAGNPLLAISAMAGALAAKKRKADDGAAAAAAVAAAGGAAARTDLQKPSGIHAEHPYFSYYGLLVHQQNMLQDGVRTSAYQHAITANAADFEGKTVMDVGTGSGVLAWFATQAGAAKVWAVEASNVADRAAVLLAANGVGDRVTVVKAKVEDVVLPGGGGQDDGGQQRVDTLVSEPMGFMLIHEQMLKSYIVARQLFLKPGGRMFPSVGTIYAAPFTDAGACVVRARARTPHCGVARAAADAAVVAAAYSGDGHSPCLTQTAGAHPTNAVLYPPLPPPAPLRAAMQRCGASRPPRRRSGTRRRSTGWT